eukprot:7130946-Alexandrium_andersonii.AAC.1
MVHSLALELRRRGAAIEADRGRPPEAQPGENPYAWAECSTRLPGLVAEVLHDVARSAKRHLDAGAPRWSSS